MRAAFAAFMQHILKRARDTYSPRLIVIIKRIISVKIQ